MALYTLSDFENLSSYNPTKSIFFAERTNDSRATNAANRAAYAMQLEDEDFAHNEAILANERNVQNWQMQNNYNSPSASVARLRAAGLNPYVMFGNEDSSGAVSGSSPASSSTGSPFKGDVSGVAQAEAQRMANVTQSFDNFATGLREMAFEAEKPSLYRAQAEMYRQASKDSSASAEERRLNAMRSQLEYNKAERTFNSAVQAGDLANLETTSRIYNLREQTQSLVRNDMMRAVELDLKQRGIEISERQLGLAYKAFEESVRQFNIQDANNQRDYFEMVRQFDESFGQRLKDYGLSERQIKAIENMQTSEKFRNYMSALGAVIGGVGVGAGQFLKGRASAPGNIGAGSQIYSPPASTGVNVGY